MRLLLAVLLAVTVTGCGGGGGGEGRSEAAEVVGTIEISSGSSQAHCVLLHASDTTYHLTPGAFTLMPARGAKNVSTKAVRASRLTDDGVRTAVLRHGSKVSVKGQAQTAPDADPCDAEKVLSVEELGK